MNKEEPQSIKHWTLMSRYLFLNTNAYRNLSLEDAAEIDDAIYNFEEHFRQLGASPDEVNYRDRHYKFRIGRK